MLYQNGKNNGNCGTKTKMTILIKCDTCGYEQRRDIVGFPIETLRREFTELYPENEFGPIKHECDVCRKKRVENHICKK